MTARLLAFALWAAVAGTVVYWGLKLFVDAPAAPPHAMAVSNAAPRADVSRLLGSAPSAGPAAAAGPANSRFKLLGVVAPRSEGGGNGIALIAVDDKPARPYRVGGHVDERWVVQAVHRRGVSLGPSGGQAELNLELAPPQAAATGTLAPGPDLGGRAPVVAPPPAPAAATAPTPAPSFPQPGGAVPVPGAPQAVPGTQPAVPGTQPAVPGTQPAVPGMQPAMPGTQPGAAGAQPGVARSPGAAPSVPPAPMVSSPQPGQQPGTVGSATATPPIQQAPPPEPR